MDKNLDKQAAGGAGSVPASTGTGKAALTGGALSILGLAGLVDNLLHRHRASSVEKAISSRRNPFSVLNPISNVTGASWKPEGFNPTTSDSLNRILFQATVLGSMGVGLGAFTQAAGDRVRGKRMEEFKEDLRKIEETGRVSKEASKAGPVQGTTQWLPGLAPPPTNATVKAGPVRGTAGIMANLIGLVKKHPFKSTAIAGTALPNLATLLRGRVPGVDSPVYVPGRGIASAIYRNFGLPFATPDEASFWSLAVPGLASAGGLIGGFSLLEAMSKAKRERDKEEGDSEIDSEYLEDIKEKGGEDMLKEGAAASALDILKSFQGATAITALLLSYAGVRKYLSSTDKNIAAMDTLKDTHRDNIMRREYRIAGPTSQLESIRALRRPPETSSWKEEEPAAEEPEQEEQTTPIDPDDPFASVLSKP